MKSQVQWTVRSDGNQLHVEYSFQNREGHPIYICQPSPPYVDVHPDGRVRIWLGLYVLGPKDIVEAPEVPPVQFLKAEDIIENKFDLSLPLHEIHPFPKYERAEKVLLKSTAIALEIGFFPYHEDHLPPQVRDGEQMIQLAPYEWASENLAYLKTGPARLSVPIEVPRKLMGKGQE